MDRGAPIWILQGRFGSATVNLTDRPLVEHAHREINILFKLCGSDTAFRSDGVVLPLDDDSVLLFNAWVPHAKFPGDGRPTMIMSLMIEPDWLGHLSGGRPTASLFPSARERLTADVRINANRLAAAIPNHMTQSATLFEDLMKDLMNALLRDYTRAQPGLISSRPIDFRIRKSLGYITTHAHENPEIEVIARHVGLSRSRFFEQFRRCLGVSPQHYIDYIRLKTAVRWLSATDRPLMQVAADLGFGSQSNFTRFFIQHLAVSPSEFRRQTINLDNDRAARADDCENV
jgi:AraC-like DNA-binding protein